jgi:2'-5' RNA ligase
MEEEKIRSFIAIELPREAINYIKQLQGLIKKQNLFTGKFTEPENLHLTLKFLGEIEAFFAEETALIAERRKSSKLDVASALLEDWIFLEVSKWLGEQKSIAKNPYQMVIDLKKKNGLASLLCK